MNLKDLENQKCYWNVIANSASWRSNIFTQTSQIWGMNQVSNSFDPFLGALVKTDQLLNQCRMSLSIILKAGRSFSHPDDIRILT